MPQSNQSEYLFNSIAGNSWRNIGTRRRAGLLIPLFSVYSESSQGIGDLNDLKLIVDLCKKAEISIVQLLPMNELGGSLSPYDSLSSFALEPVYISLEKLNIKSSRSSFQERLFELRKKFPAGKKPLNYQIRAEKEKLLRDIFRKEFDSIPEEFNNFRQDNSYWIEDFALYKAIKEFQGQKPWYQWQEEYRHRDASTIEHFYKEKEKEIIFTIWQQWQLYKQFKEAKDYARSKDILLKGDLPILVSRDSADVWAHPEFFKLGYAAGAPVDMYAAKGQRWDMPTYDWEKIAADDYRYLKEKLKFAQNFYDLLRIDHVAGLFRIWSIPYDDPQENKGLNGSFDPADEGKWQEHGRRSLSIMLENTKMLLCAEDLGTIPPSCPKVLKELAIPGNDVQRWNKDWQVTHDFLEPRDYRFLAVAMLSTHDTTNWAAWWENEAGTIDEPLFIRRCVSHAIDYEAVKAKLFDLTLSRHARLRWLKAVDSIDKLAGILGKKKEEITDIIDMYENTYGEKEKLWQKLGIKGSMKEKADKKIMSAALGITLKSASIFCIELVLDWLYLAGIFKGDSYNHRINVPGTISEDNWSYVIPASLEDLLNNKVLREIKGLVISSDRAKKAIKKVASSVE